MKLAELQAIKKDNQSIVNFTLELDGKEVAGIPSKIMVFINNPYEQYKLIDIAEDTESALLQDENTN